MKTLLFLLLSLAATAQCSTPASQAGSYLALPGFLNLYLSGQCVSAEIRDTTICVLAPRMDIGQVAAFSFSTPNGSSATVSMKQYDQNCELLQEDGLISPGYDTVTVCYEIHANTLDNFCPYLVQANALAVTWCSMYAYYDNGGLHVRFITCSNAGTLRYEILQSSDAQLWTNIGTLKPRFQTCSTECEYRLDINWHKGGENYIMIREVDVNGDLDNSDIMHVFIPYPVNPKLSGIDLMGRQTLDTSFQFVTPVK